MRRYQEVVGDYWAREVFAFPVWIQNRVCTRKGLMMSWTSRIYIARRLDDTKVLSLPENSDRAKNVLVIAKWPEWIDLKCRMT